MAHDTIDKDTRKAGADRDRAKRPDENRDPVSGEPGAHPIGTGVGAAGGAAAGAAAGMAAGPGGAAAGAVIGAVVGGLAGKNVAEHYDPTAEQAYWRENYTREPYYRNGMSFDEYWPAYHLGNEWRTRYPDHMFDDVESQIAHEYETMRGDSRLDWEDAREAARAAWNRLGTARRRAR